MALPLAVAPYSYDLIDNFGRRSPRELTPAAADLKVGDEFLIVHIREIEPGRRISGRANGKAEKIFGPVALTYAVEPLDGERSRIVMKGWLGKRGPLGGVTRAMLVFGNAIMMRKQLTTLRDLAERDQLRARSA